MRSQLYRIIPGLILSLMMSWIAHGQPSLGDSVTISRAQQRQCIKWHDEIDTLRLRIIPAKDLIIKNLEDFKDSTSAKIERYQAELNNQKAKTAKEVKRKKIWRGIGIGAGIVAVLECVLLWIGIK